MRRNDRSEDHLVANQSFIADAYCSADAYCPSTYFHEMIDFSDELHVAILDAIMNHFDEMTGASLAHPVATRFSVHFCRNRLKDVLDVRPSLRDATGHDRRPVTSSVFTAGNTGADKMKT